MRIVGGESKGRRIKTQKNKKGLRPLSEQVREALFNILGAGVPESNFLDLFAGTGAVGLEALSRGAASAFFVEKDGATAGIIKENLSDFGYLGQAEVYVQDVYKALIILEHRVLQFDFIFVGAPYGSGLLTESLAVLSKGTLLRPKGIVIAEHHKKEVLPEQYGVLSLLKSKFYGDTVLNFYGRG